MFTESLPNEENWFSTNSLTTQREQYLATQYIPVFPVSADCQSRKLYKLFFTGCPDADSLSHSASLKLYDCFGRGELLISTRNRCWCDNNRLLSYILLLIQPHSNSLLPVISNWEINVIYTINSCTLELWSTWKEINHVDGKYYNVHRTC